jgi:uncharacterized membrane protein SpoIIM required for sporulation
MLKNKKIYIFIFLLAFFTLLVWLSKTKKQNGFTPRLRAMVRPHVRTLERVPTVVFSGFTQDNFIRFLHRWKLW